MNNKKKIYIYIPLNSIALSDHPAKNFVTTYVVILTKCEPITRCHLSYQATFPSQKGLDPITNLIYQDVYITSTMYSCTIHTKYITLFVQ